MEFSVDRPARPPVAYLSGVLLCCVHPVVLSCVALCCVALCGDLLFVVSCGCVPVALHCVVLHCVAICCVFFGPLVLRCVVLFLCICRI